MGRPQGEWRGRMKTFIISVKSRDGRDLRMKTRAVLGLLFLTCPLMQPEDRLWALGLAM